MYLLDFGVNAGTCTKNMKLQHHYKYPQCEATFKEGFIYMWCI